MNPVGNQQFCGSCWAFATVHAIEGNYNIQFGNSPSFSQQQLVDCNSVNYGCKGGYPDKALDYIIGKGLAYSITYPYISGITGTQDACKDSRVQTNKIVSSYEHCRYMRCTKKQQRKLLSKGPVIVYIDGDGKSLGNTVFHHYKGGVLDMPCVQVNHAVVLTGIDYDEKGEYLIGMNSWGAGWGENGHFRMRTRAHDYSCFMESFGVLPYVRETVNSLPPPPVPGCLRVFSECGMKGQVKEICSNTPVIPLPYTAGYNIGKFKTVKIFYEDQYCKGSYFPITDRSYSCFALEAMQYLDNRIKSVIVDEQIPPAGCVWFYDDYCLAGNKIELCGDIGDLSHPKFNFVNKISSFKFGPGVRGLIVFLDKFYGGATSTVMGDTYSLHGTWLNKDIESLKIIR